MKEGEGLLERGGFANCFISFPSEKHVFITIGFFLSGKYSHLLQSVLGRNKCVCSSSHALCYRRMRSCEIHNSFVSYDGTSFVLVALAWLIVIEPKH